MLSFLFLFTHERAHEVLADSPPVDVLLSNLIYGNKKDVGVSSFRRLSLSSGLSMPLPKDKQLWRLPTP